MRVKPAIRVAVCCVGVGCARRRRRRSATPPSAPTAASAAASAAMRAWGGPLSAPGAGGQRFGTAPHRRPDTPACPRRPSPAARGARACSRPAIAAAAHRSAHHRLHVAQLQLRQHGARTPRYARAAHIRRLFVQRPRRRCSQTSAEARLRGREVVHQIKRALARLHVADQARAVGHHRRGVLGGEVVLQHLHHRLPVAVAVVRKRRQRPAPEAQTRPRARPRPP